MSPELILKAGIRDMLASRRSPHCYSAHVIGQGWVNRGENPATRADYYRQLERDATNEVDNIGFSPAYAELGYTQPRKGILFANWNKFPTNIDRLLERAGYAIEWSDEWTTCEDCNKAFRTQPDSYCWEPAGVIGDGTCLCNQCIKANE